MQRSAWLLDRVSWSTLCLCTGEKELAKFAAGEISCTGIGPSDGSRKKGNVKTCAMNDFHCGQSNHPQKEGNYFIAPKERGAVGFKFLHSWLESRPARPGYHIWDILDKGLQEKGPHLRRKGGLAWNLCPGLFRDCLVQALPTFSPSSQQLKAPSHPPPPPQEFQGILKHAPPYLDIKPHRHSPKVTHLFTF